MTVIDWNSELRRIEREFDGLPPEPTNAARRARRIDELRAREAAERRSALVGAGARLLLVVALVASIFWWPYASRCGFPLVALVAAQAMIVIGGLWVTVYTWQHHYAVAHAIALTLVVTGLTLVAIQVLPRTGRVRIDGVHATGWSCAAETGARG